ncbi:hypothetical protein B0H17DRAFT_1152771, partial [Mycena rosella]
QIPPSLASPGWPAADAAVPINGVPSTTVFAAFLELLPDDIIDQPPSPSDKPGSFYDFVILDDNDNNDDAEVVKFGRTAHPTKRPRQWVRQYKGQHQHWQYHWEVPFAVKFISTWRLESLIHEHFKRAGAWLGPSKCGFCPVSHLDKYDYCRCGRRDAMVEVVETYLRRLSCVIVSTMRGICIMPRRGEFIGLPGFEGINKWLNPPANLAFQDIELAKIARGTIGGQNRCCGHLAPGTNMSPPNCVR